MTIRAARRRRSDRTQLSTPFQMPGFPSHPLRLPAFSQRSSVREGFLAVRQLRHTGGAMCPRYALAGQERVMGIEPTPPAWKAGALPLSYTRRGCLDNSLKDSIWQWREQDSNLRRHCHQIYSLAPLATRVSRLISSGLRAAPSPQKSKLVSTEVFFG